MLAIDELIERCEPTQVRHMMQVIEPQFQRDFISLLPKELALSVLAFLEPKDLLRAAQTCRNWRFLADDNLLWKEKCKAAGIEDLKDLPPPKRKNCRSASYNSSPWKQAYMRQHNIKMNWRTKPIRTPKVLKGHDDHVITCLQFSGNRIVSGSDDNTLKVWSAVTGKVTKLYRDTGILLSRTKQKEKINVVYCVTFSVFSPNVSVLTNISRTYRRGMVLADVRHDCYQW